MQNFIKKYYGTGFGDYGYTPTPNDATAWADTNNAMASTNNTSKAFDWNALIKDTLSNTGGIINSISNLSHGTTPPPNTVIYQGGAPTALGMSKNTLVAIGAILLLIVILVAVVMMSKMANKAS